MSQPDWDLKLKPTNIDRHKCHRVRPMEVLCLGLERTGTLSLRAALYHLGYFDVYHASSALMENPLDCDMWVEAVDATFNGKGTFPREDWDHLLGHCMAVTDQPAATFAKELVGAYPDAKILLTVRDSPEAWHKSMEQTICQVMELLSPKHLRKPSWNPLYIIQKMLHPRRPGPQQQLLDKLLVHQDTDEVPIGSVRMYQEHNEMVRELAKGREFLKYNVKEGWGPLCKFLGKPVPDIPFPSLNDSEAYASRLRMLRLFVATGYVINLAKWMAVPALAAAMYYYYGSASR
jgi:hypothetical protein